MLQQEHRQINHGKSMHHLTFPTNYKQTMNNLIKAKNNSTTLTPVSTTILDSSNRNQEQLQQTAHTSVNYTDNTMGSTATVAKPPTQSVGNYGGNNSSPSTMGVNLRVTGQCSQGGRKYMEDYFSVAYQQSENAKDLEYAFIGIYDGHGGAEAATFAKEHLMMQIINQKAFWSESDHDVLRAIREGYIATHYAMWRDQENWPKTANGLLSTAGTTATIAFIRREKIYIGHVGDSGIVLGYQNEGEKYWRARQLTVDHKPESTEERARIQRSGGKVVVKSGVPRVVWNRPRNAGHRGPIRCNTPVDEVPFLAVARSLGDLWSYNSKRNVFVVSPDPDVQVIKINPKTFRCLIFGTDGLWNVVTPQEAVDSVHERECINERLQAYTNADNGNNEWTNPSKSLVERALKTWSSKKMRADNTSVVTVILYPSANDTTNTNCVAPNTLSYNNLPKDSCGLEYTEVCAEVPASESYGISYEEIAEKHTMPEAFRNFDYLIDEEAINASLQMQHEENCERKYCSEEMSYWNNWSWEEHQSDCAGDYNHHVSTLATNSDVSICSKAIASHNTLCNTNGTITGDSDENAVDGVHTCAVNDNAECETAVLKYAHYSADASNASSDVSNELGNAGFMTFAESYNSFLNEHMSHDSTNSSNSNSNCQIISGTSEILQEQQLYQQQCMSEEEGYSLTKLETRREQQRCTSGVQTFKIFQTLDTSGTSYVPQRVEQQENNLQRVVEQTSRDNANLQLHTTATAQLTVEETRELEAALTWEPSECAPLATTIDQYLTYPAEHQKPLELNSLLQQEREEEQQVAYERLEMQRRLAQTNVIKVATVHAERTDSKVEAEQTVTLPIEEVEDVLVEEYIEEDEVENDDLQLTKASNTVQKDARVQINEISSSMSEHTNCDSSSSSSDNEMLAPTSAMPSQKTQIIEKIEKIEILPQKLPTKLERLSSHTLLTTQKTPRHTQYKKATGTAAVVCTASTPAASHKPSEKVKVTSYDFTSRPPKACPARTSLKRSQTQFPNIPNENARAASESTSSHTLSKRRRYDAYNDYVLGAVSSTSNKTIMDVDNTNSTSNNCRNRRCNTNASMVHSSSTNCGTITLEKRQLRSNSGIVDYSKRTLRTRNSLSKDLKAKASLTSTMRRVTSQFLHETAVSLMSSSSALAQQRQQQRSVNGGASSGMALNRSGSGTNNHSCSSSSSVGRRARAEKLLTTSSDNLEAAFSHVINLRSRKVAHFAVAAAAAAAAVNHTQTTRRAKGIVGSSPLVTTSASTVLRRERHNLRSLSTRNAASPPGLMSANGQHDYAYGKTQTRSGLHATGMCAYSLTSNAAPTSKLLNGTAGVNVATRPRTHALLLAKQSVGAGGGGAVSASGMLGVRGGSSATTALATPTSYGKRTTALRSGAVGSGSASTIMLTRSGGRNGRRLNR
ncbi:uncharacterized protein LOC126760233 [Bactrocera neohumeralis]|uniref:uncharacterized protein LOC126760233 n=1 Tax=Bactrocera neohumeralis TaxID=98809 RepID=UPI002164F74E|nr:uncharacterized protein LOC126760233 [Bactrocera neohumeralis]XP_050331670.1 uncharacterized protein LOC126760233 [Bactrocera neohumeralis]